MKQKGLGNIVIFLFIFLTAVIIGYFMLKKEDRLPIYQPGDINPALVDESVRNNTNHHTLPFTLVNQDGEVITEELVDDKIHVAAFFFTRCATLCPKISESMSKVQMYFEGQSEPVLISHSVTPVMDSVPILNRYAEKYKANSDMWHLVTGEKPHIYELARKSYFAVKDEGDGGLQDFIHTENLVLVDREGRLRGFYDGTSSEEVGQMIIDIETLQREYE